MRETRSWEVCGLGPVQRKVLALVIDLGIVIRGQDEVSKGSNYRNDRVKGLGLRPGQPGVKSWV